LKVKIRIQRMQILTSFVTSLHPAHVLQDTLGRAAPMLFNFNPHFY